MPTLEERVTALEGQVLGLLNTTQAQAREAATAAPQSGPVADDHELDGQYGNPVVKFKDPPRWTGKSYVGATFAECPSDYLNVLASFLEWRAVKEEAEPGKEKYAQWSRLDAKRARGWARRNMGKVQAPSAPAAPVYADTMDDLGF